MCEVCAEVFFKRTTCDRCVGRGGWVPSCWPDTTDATRRQMLASSFEMGIGKSFDCCAHSSMSPIGGGPNEIISMEELSDANDSASDLCVCGVHR